MHSRVDEQQQKAEPRVFISYSHEDENWAKDFARLVEEHGISVWLDIEDVPHGAVIAETVERALRGSNILVVLVPEDLAKQPNLLFELGAAIGMGKTVVPIVPRDLGPSVLPGFLRGRGYLIKDIPATTAQLFISELQRSDSLERFSRHREGGDNHPPKDANR